jgi:hypothetical protein
MIIQGGKQLFSVCFPSNLSKERPYWKIIKMKNYKANTGGFSYIYKLNDVSL